MTEFERKIEDRFEKRFEGRRHYTGDGRKWSGLFILLIGVAALLKSLLLPVPAWVFSWPMILVAVGFFIGIRHNFRGGAWFVLILLGGVFLLNESFPNIIDQRFLWPIALIIVGAFLILKPRRRDWHFQEYPQTAANEAGTLLPPDEETVSSEDLMDSTSVFGGIKKSILSKNFKGGEVVNIMGGTEINLSQADIQGRAVLDVTQIFGGTKIIVPAHWEVKPEMAAIFGGIDDKRSLHNVTPDHSKVLILKGTSIFGGIEIKSF